MRPTIITLLAYLLTSQVFVKAQDYEVKALSINEKFSNEMAPFMLDSTLYFCSDRRNTTFVNYTNQNNQNIYRWYQAKYSNGKWSVPTVWMPNLQNKINNGPISFAVDGTKLAVTQNMQKNRGLDKGEAKMGLVIYEQNGSKFNNKKTFPFNDLANYSVGHPSFSPDGKTLFFTSDMNKGYGKTDIYISEFKNDTWSEPINLGKMINTPNDEIFPFCFSPDRLYFASNGLAGKGGFDIYYSIRKNGQWSEPVALPDPINSEADDYACFINANGETGFFTSNRGHSDNIYSFKSLIPDFPIKTQQVVDNYCFTFFEDGPYKADTIPVFYRWSFGDGQTAEGKQADHCFAGPGNYHVTLNAVDLIQKIDLLTVADYQVDLIKTEQVFISAPDSVKTGTNLNLSAAQSYLPNIVPTEYYWEMGDGTKLKGIEIQYTFTAPGTYTISCGTVDKNDPTLKYCSTKEIIVTE
jgi:Tol biopolymer transport system component/plastocyanin